MAPTKLLYLEDFYLLRCAAKVEEILEDNGKTIVILDQTVFYPQGGGQPYDTGKIRSANGVFQVAEVRFLEGIVKHIGQFESGSFTAGEQVVCEVDAARRTLHTRLHSAGHLVDMAVHALHLDWVPGKGFHFPEGPYVEYAGTLEGLDKDKLKADIEAQCNRLIQEGRETKLVFMDKEQMASVCHHVPDYIPEGKPARVVMYGDFGIPCGGTHVRNIAEIKNMIIRKLKMDGKNIRVAYDVVR